MANTTDLAHVLFLPIWNKFEGEKQVRFRVSALAEIVKIVVALDRSVLRALKKGGIIK